MEKQLRAHLSDDELLVNIYAAGSPDGHLEKCAECKARLQALLDRRAAVEGQSRAEEEVSFDFLAAQRRQIYARIDRQQKTSWFHGVRRWATAAGLFVALGGGVVLLEERHVPTDRDTVSDAQLAVDVSQFAADPEPPPAAPLRALFQE